MKKLHIIMCKETHIERNYSILVDHYIFWNGQSFKRLFRLRLRFCGYVGNMNCFCSIF